MKPQQQKHAEPLMALVEETTRQFAEARKDLTDRVRALNEEIEKAKRKHLAGIRRCVDEAAAYHAALHGVIEENPQLFDKPRTFTFSGIKVGYRKATGEITWDDQDRVVELIRKHLPDQFDVLVQTKHKPLKEALAQVPAADLKKLGVRVAEDGDEVYIKPTDSDIDKLVTALLKNAVEEEIES